MLAAAVALVLGVLAAAGWFFAGAAAPSYLAGWLFWVGAPLGALPLVMGFEAAGRATWPPVLVLRRMLLLLPVGALLIIPVLLGYTGLYRRPGVQSPLPADWMAPGFFVGRSIVILAVLSLLAVVFSQAPRRPRRALAWLGMVVHLCLVSVAAVDWVMSLQPGLGSSVFGLLLIAAQIGLAACLALFVLAVGTRGAPMPAGSGLVLGVLILTWGFLHFVQFLVVWSANLPAEVTWYLVRGAGLGGGVVWFGVTAALASLALLLTPLARVPAVLASLAATLLLAHLAETLWLVTPTFRGAFTVTGPDVLALVGLGGLLVGLLLLMLPRRMREVAHAAR